MSEFFNKPYCDAWQEMINPFHQEWKIMQWMNQVNIKTLTNKQKPLKKKQNKKQKESLVQHGGHGFLSAAQNHNLGFTILGQS